MRIAIVQMTSGADIEANLRTMEKTFFEAVEAGAELVAFPEMAYLMSPSAIWKSSLDRYGEILGRFATWAARGRAYLLPGTLREPVGNGRYYNTLAVLDPRGQPIARYRKIFRFRAELPDRHYDESEFCEAGGEVVTLGAGGIRAGLAICFDLRFPEMFRALKKRGAEVIFLPSAFTAITGEAHWKTLVRARAIENQVFMVCPAQTGIVGDGGKTHGHALVVSPWGEVIADGGQTPGAQHFDLDPRAIEDCRRKVAAWESRREDLFPIG